MSNEKESFMAALDHIFDTLDKSDIDVIEVTSIRPAYRLFESDTDHIRIGLVLEISKHTYDGNGTDDDSDKTPTDVPDSAIETDGISTIHVKIELLKRGLSVSEVARRLGARRDMVSHVINGRFNYPALRKQLRQRYGIVCPPARPRQRYSNKSNKKAA